MKNLIEESMELKAKYKREASVAGCEQLEEWIEEARVLLRYIHGVKTESARMTYLSLNKELLLLWAEFFKRCPKMAKRYLNKCTRVSVIS